MFLDTRTFNILVGESLFTYQAIENEVKLIYALMDELPTDVSYYSTSSWTLKKSLVNLQKIDQSNGSVFTTDQYQRLLDTCKIKNYLCNRVYRDSIYESEVIFSHDFEMACARLIKIHEELELVREFCVDVRIRLQRGNTSGRLS